MTVELAAVVVFFTAAVSMALPVATADFPTILTAFLVLETCVGAFYSCSGLMRSRYIPGGLQSSVMNIFRLPLNVLVVVGTRITDLARSETVFTVISTWFLASALLQLRLTVSPARLRDSASQGMGRCASEGRSGGGGQAGIGGTKELKSQ